MLENALNNISVHLRIKPNTHATSPNSNIQISDRNIKIYQNEFNFDSIFLTNSQTEIYKFICQSQIDRTFQGFNCTIMAYGQTGSGKTYTIQGEEIDYGIIPRVLCQLFEKVDRNLFSMESDIDFLNAHEKNYLSIKITYLEVYNEKINDLLSSEEDISTSCVNSSFVKENYDSKPQIRENMKGPYVTDVNYAEVRTLEEAKNIFMRGNTKRKIASTKMNERSSRSHTIFTIYLKFQENCVIKRSKINIVDLAGSESLKNIKSLKNKKESGNSKETGNINRSLFYLSEVIKKLSSDEEKHINYRDSKLTHILKDSLGGNSLLSVIGTVNLEYLTESQNTLNFLKRTKNIKKLVTQNFDLADKPNQFYYEELKKLSNENLILRMENDKLKDKNVRKNYDSEDIVDLLDKIKCIEEELDMLHNYVHNLIDEKIEIKQEDVLKDDDWI